MITIAYPSVQSLYLETRANGHALGQGTGFVVSGAKGPVLTTSWHVLSGRDPGTKQPLSPTGAVPDELGIVHNSTRGLGTWITVAESLLANGRPRWTEHPKYAEKVDVVALPLTNTAGVQLYPHDLLEGPRVRVGPAEPVSVIGFPFGIQAGGSLAVWATGYLASEPSIDYQGLPLMLVDCRARQGQSGSAVIAYRAGGAIAMESGDTVFMRSPVSRFLGCYSGRVNAESDLGLVWKTAAVKDVADAVP